MTLKKSIHSFTSSIRLPKFSQSPDDASTGHLSGCVCRLVSEAECRISTLKFQAHRAAKISHTSLQLQQNTIRY